MDRAPKAPVPLPSNPLTSLKALTTSGLVPQELVMGGDARRNILSPRS
jgi:hypothetical protein